MAQGLTSKLVLTLQNARWTIMRHGAYVFGIASVAADIVDLAWAIPEESD